MGVTDGRIRNLVVGLAVRDGHVLLEEYPGDAWRGSFLRALGGGLEFGERLEEAVVREFDEELGIRVRVERALGASDNIFTWQGEPAHEVVHAYVVSAPELDAWPLDERRRILDQATEAGWWPIADLPTRDVYPDRVTTLIEELSR